MIQRRVTGNPVGEIRTPRREVFAWGQISVSSSSLTLIDGENVTSTCLTWNSTGDYSIDFLNVNPQSSGYAVTVAAQTNAASIATGAFVHLQTITSTGIRTAIFRASDSTPNYDPPIVTFVAIGAW